MFRLLPTGRAWRKAASTTGSARRPLGGDPCIGRLRRAAARRSRVQYRACLVCRVPGQGSARAAGKRHRITLIPRGVHGAPAWRCGPASVPSLRSRGCRTREPGRRPEAPPSLQTLPRHGRRRRAAARPARNARRRESLHSRAVAFSSKASCQHLHRQSARPRGLHRGAQHMPHPPSQQSFGRGALPAYKCRHTTFRVHRSAQRARHCRIRAMPPAIRSPDVECATRRYRAHGASGRGSARRRR